MTTQNPTRVEVKRPDPLPLWQRRSTRAFAVFAIAAIVRIPFQATYLVNWDSVNFALGLESFNLENHQPHPPGYLGYVLLGRFIDWFVGNPVAALTGISVVAGAAATMWVYILGTKMLSERAALIAAALFGTSPLVWYYSEVPLTYIVEVALALPFVLLVLEARKHHSAKYLALATVLLALMGAVRQTSLVLFLPLWIYGWWPFSRQVKTLGAALLGGLVALWLTPLLVLSGGISNYLLLSRQLAELTGGATWLGAGAGVIQNFAVVGMASVVGLHVALLALPLNAVTRSTSEPMAVEHRRLLLIWGLPPLLTYLFIHSGQLGYVLVLLPIGIFWAATVFSRVVPKTMALAAGGLLVAVNSLGFFVLPEIAYASVSEGRVTLPDEMANRTLVKRGIQQVSIPRNDAHWESLIAWVEGFNPDTVAVLAEPRDGGSFRHLSFYLPRYLVFGLGTGQSEAMGHLFTSNGLDIDYNVDHLDDAADHLEFPTRVRTLLIPDPRLQELFEGVLDLEYSVLENGAMVAVAEIPWRSSLLFLGPDGDPSLQIPTPPSSQAADNSQDSNEEAHWSQLGIEGP
jgi:hypothetical protein